MREENKLEREQKARERQEEKKRKKLEQEKKAQERQKKKERKAKELKKKAKKQRRARSTKRAPSPAVTLGLESLFTQLDVEDNGLCSSCGMVFSQEDEDRFWVCCDRCYKWVCFACHKLPTKDSVPDEFYCVKCT